MMLIEIINANHITNHITKKQTVMKFKSFYIVFIFVSVIAVICSIFVRSKAIFSKTVWSVGESWLLVKCAAATLLKLSYSLIFIDKLQK